MFSRPTFLRLSEKCVDTPCDLQNAAGASFETKSSTNPDCQRRMALEWPLSSHGHSMAFIERV